MRPWLVWWLTNYSGHGLGLVDPDEQSIEAEISMSSSLAHICTYPSGDPQLSLNRIWDILQCLRGILVKLVICVVPGHWKIKILNLKKRNKFFCFFMFLYPIQGGKNIGSPYLTNKSWFFGKSDVPGQQNKSYIGVMASKNLIFLMFWLSFVYL